MKFKPGQKVKIIKNGLMDPVPIGKILTIKKFVKHDIVNDYIVSEEKFNYQGINCDNIWADQVELINKTHMPEWF